MPLSRFPLMSSSFRRLTAYATVTIFILFFLISGINSPVPSALSASNNGVSPRFPDFSKYLQLVNLSQEQFPLEDEKKRVILIGDIHGRYDDLQRLLQKVSYNPSSDIFISVGDIVAKGTHAGSMQVLRFMSSNNITAVRGNHDQKVIEWRTWMKWIRSIRGGERWLRLTEEKWLAYKGREDRDIEEWVVEQAKHDKANRKWWEKIPKGWKLFGDHYDIASKMSDEDYQYMVSRPLRIHVPSAHAFIVHAGVLASDPKHDPWDERQPLATIPSSTDFESEALPDNTLRRLQELAILTKVPPNLDPWVTLNMRGVKKGGEVTRDKDGTPWAELYNEDMSRCKGFSTKVSKHRKTSLPCQPATVIYGHAASRGLDIKRWTLGLDSGCVYKRHLTALVLGGEYASHRLDGNGDEDDEDGVFDIEGERVESVVDFGDQRRGKLVSVSCH
ncbi:Metallo-dependent phosphatase [Marasmius fiardii PR-910]|nr:Metallo-dependent phosphatase [Marasmius fiardii PR-910]